MLFIRQATKLNNVSEAKRIWDAIMSGHNREAEFWLEYIRLLRLVLCTATVTDDN